MLPLKVVFLINLALFYIWYKNQDTLLLFAFEYPVFSVTVDKNKHFPIGKFKTH